MILYYTKTFRLREIGKEKLIFEDEIEHLKDEILNDF